MLLVIIIIIKIKKSSISLLFFKLLLLLLLLVSAWRVDSHPCHSSLLECAKRKYQPDSIFDSSFCVPGCFSRGVEHLRDAVHA